MRKLAAQRRDRARQGVGNRDFPLGQIDPLKLLLHRVADRRLLLGRQAAECRSETGLGEILLGQLGQAHQREGGVVLAEIGAHAVQAPVIHQVGFLETGLAGDDVVGRHQRRAAGRDEPVGLRRGALVGQHRRPGEQRKTADGHREQYPFEDVADRIFLDPRTDRRAAIHRVPSFPLVPEKHAQSAEANLHTII